jgi:dihydropyrimidine dehydrogenase (NAD+) subunit PreT
MEKGFTMDQAIAEAARCLLCHDAPCSAGCPATTEPDRFIRKLRLRNIKGAVATIKENNILGGVCAVVCPTCTLCAGGCTATELDKPIRIGEIQRWLVEWAGETGFNPLRRKEPNGIRVAIIGGGPSGIACAAELAKEGYSPVIFEKEAQVGGMLRYAIPEHRVSNEFLERDLADVTALGVEFRCSSPIDGIEGLHQLFDDGFKSVYVATGTWQALQLDVPNRASEDLHSSLAFLKLAKVDAKTFGQTVAGRNVAVIGGGDTAMDCAVTAKRAGAADVSIIYRRSFSEMPGSPDEKDFAIAEGIHFLVLTQPIDYLIAEGKVTGMKVVRNRLGAPDASGRRRPEALPGSEHSLPADIVVEAVGLAPVKTVGKLGLEVDKADRIIVSDNLATSLGGVFAGGDAVRGGSIVANGVRDGKLAAQAIVRHLQEVK